jgi:hypothetical protein
MHKRWLTRICHPGRRAGGAYRRVRFLWSLTFGVAGARCFYRFLFDLVHRARYEALLTGDELQQFRELHSLLSGKSHQKGLLMFSIKPGSGAICRLPCLGQVQGMVTPVPLVRPALQQTFPFELVEIAHHSARECSESAGECALTETWRTGQDFENAGVCGSELQQA